MFTLFADKIVQIHDSFSGIFCHYYLIIFVLQVTYSQLELGENIRSYNNRQSNPNIRAEISGGYCSSAAAAEDSSTSTLVSGRRNSESHVPRKSWASTKSAPASRGASPTRSRKATYTVGTGTNNQFTYQNKRPWEMNGGDNESYRNKAYLGGVNQTGFNQEGKQTFTLWC